MNQKNGRKQQPGRRPDTGRPDNARPAARQAAMYDQTKERPRQRTAPQAHGASGRAQSGGARRPEYREEEYRAMRGSREDAPRQNAPNRRDGAQPRPVQREANHAPLYDQYDGPARRPEPEADTARARRLRQKEAKKKRRLTQAEIRRRKLRRRIMTWALITAAVIGGILLSGLLLFKISKFEVQGIDGSMPADTGIYTEDEIIAALGLQKGDNLFSFRAKDVKTILDAKFPLLENVRILRRLPGTVIIRVQPAKETYCVKADVGWATLSAGLKVISIGEEQPALPQIKGLVIETPQVGASLTLKDAGQQALLQTVLSSLDSAGLLADTTYLSLGDAEQISFIYADRVRVALGTSNSLDYKLKLAGYILANAKGDGLSDTDRGILVVSDLLSDGTIQPRFSQGDPHASDAADDDAAAAAAAAVATGGTAAGSEASASGASSAPASAASSPASSAAAASPAAAA